MGPIAPNEDNRRTVHVSQPKTTRQGLWIGPHVFHMKFDTIDVRVNTKRIYHRRLYTLQLLAFGHDRSGLLSSSWGLLSATCSCKRLLLSSSFMTMTIWDDDFSSPSDSLMEVLRRTFSTRNCVTKIASRDSHSVKASFHQSVVSRRKWKISRRK